MHKQKSESTIIDLNDVLNFISKADRRQKRIIDLSLKQKKNNRYHYLKGKPQYNTEVYWHVCMYDTTIVVVDKASKKPVRIMNERRLEHAS